MVYTLINFYNVYRFLATGESYRSLGFSYRISPVTVRVIVSEVCQVIWNSMKGTHLSIASTEEDWKLIAKHFEVIWNFPHCIGKLDGKHIAIQAPRKSGSLYFNYKGFFQLCLWLWLTLNINSSILMLVHQEGTVIEEYLPIVSVQKV